MNSQKKTRSFEGTEVHGGFQIEDEENGENAGPFQQRERTGHPYFMPRGI